MEKMLTYNIRITKPAPSMSQDRVVFQASTYAEAVQVAHRAFLEHRRPVTLGSGEYGMDNWHRVDSDGKATDRCTNGGVPEIQFLMEAVYHADCPACLRGRPHSQSEHEGKLRRVYEASLPEAGL